MIYRGTVCDGVVVFPPDVHLPDGLDVTVQPVAPQTGQTPPAHAQGTQETRNGVAVFPPSDARDIPDLQLVNKLRDPVP